MSHAQSHNKIISEGGFDNLSIATQSTFLSLANSIDDHIKSMRLSHEPYAINREYEEAMRQLRLFCPFGLESKVLEQHIKCMMESLISEKGSSLAELRLPHRLRRNFQ